MSVMNTYSGRKFDPMKIAPEDVYLEDIAHALSLVCRGGGQIRCCLLYTSPSPRD